MSQRICGNCKYVLPEQYQKTFCPICGFILELDESVNYSPDLSEESEEKAEESTFQENEIFADQIIENDQVIIDEADNEQSEIQSEIQSSPKEEEDSFRMVEKKSPRFGKIKILLISMVVICALLCLVGKLAEEITPEPKTPFETVTFGNYEQDNNINNGKEPIEWLVVKKENGKYLLLSKYGLDCQPYNEKDIDVTWETCTLRQWLNSTFLNDAFSLSQKIQVKKMPVQTPDIYRGYDANNQWVVNNTGEGIADLKFHVSGGNATKDQVFLLSMDQARSLLGDEKDSYGHDPNLQISATAYAKAQGAYISSQYMNTEGSEYCWWWLRTPDDDASFAKCVSSDSGVNSNRVNAEDVSVRPALWVSSLTYFLLHSKS